MHSMQKLVLVLTVLVFGLQAIVAQDYNFGEVSVEELQEKFHPDDVEADAAILYREFHSNIEYYQERGFVVKTRVFERVKIYNPDGFDWGTKQVVLFQGSSSKGASIAGLKGVTYTLEDSKIVETKLHRDGIFSEKRNEFYNIEKFTLPNLKPGCIIEYRYEIMSPFVSSIDEIRLQEEVPVNKAYITFSSPEWLIYQMHRKGFLQLEVQESTRPDKVNYTIKPGVATTNGGRFGGSGKVRQTTINFQRKKYTIEIENIPPMKEEAFSTNIDNYRASVRFELSYTKYPGEPFETITSSWDAVSETIYDSERFGGQLKNQRFFDEDIDALIEEATSVEDKVVRIYEYVKNRMSWDNFLGIYAKEGVKEAYKKGAGNSADINLMLVSMLQYAGLDANPVILSTRDNGIPIYPTREGFNHVIAGVTLDGETILLDATYKLGAVNLLKEDLLNWQGRLIRENGTSQWVNLYPTRHAVENAIVDFSIDKKLVVRGTAKSRFTGHYGLNYRREFIGKAKEQYLEGLEKIHTGVEISAIELSNLDNLYDPLEVSFDFEMLNGGLEEIGGKLYISPLLYLTQAENPFKSDKRSHPVDFRYPWKNRYIFKLRIPEGYSVESLPENKAMGLVNNLGFFKYIISQSAANISISAEMSINSSVIPPEFYQDLKKFYEMIIKKQNEKIVLIKI